MHLEHLLVDGRECLVLISRYFVEKEGRTAYERFRGKKSKTLAFEIWESVHCQGRLHKVAGAEPVWHNGRLCGKRPQHRWPNRNPPSEERHRRIEKEMKNDSGKRTRFQEEKKRRP